MNINSTIQYNYSNYIGQRKLKCTIEHVVEKEIRELKLK